MYNLSANITTSILPITYSKCYTPTCGGGWPENGCWPTIQKVNLSQIKTGARGTTSFAGQMHALTIGW